MSHFFSSVGREVDQQTTRLTKEDSKDEDDGPSYRTFISLEIDRRSTASTSVAFVKRSPSSLLDEGEEITGETND